MIPHRTPCHPLPQGIFLTGERKGLQNFFFSLYEQIPKTISVSKCRKTSFWVVCPFCGRESLLESTEASFDEPVKGMGGGGFSRWRESVAKVRR